MNFNRENKNGIEVIRITGNLVLTGVKEIKDQLKPVIDDESVSKYVINLSGVSMVDSSGIGFLVSSFNAVKKRQAAMIFCNLNNTLLEIFKSTHLHTIFKIVESEEKALTAF